MSATCLRSARCAISMCAIRRRLTPIMLPVQCVSRSTNGMPPQRPPFAKTAYWDSALNALGVDPTLTAVTYDGGAMTNAARVWFILQYYGLKAVIVNGGWPILAGTTGLPPAAAVSSVGFRAVQGSGPVGLVDRETLRDQLDGRAHVFDTRTRAIAPAAAICRGPGTCRMWTCWRTAWFARPQLCTRCWSGSGSARAIIS
jgi:hypothetical protein